MQLNSENDPLCDLSGSRLVKIGFVRNMVSGASTVLTAWLATLHKDRFIERQLGQQRYHKTGMGRSWLTN